MSSGNDDRTDRVRVIYREKSREFVELHDQVEASANLLDLLESFLSTFQNDLSAVSGQISELQDRSKDIDNRLQTRRRIEKPLSNLLSDITIPPSLAITILDSDVGEPWILTIVDFEKRFDTLKTRSRVKAAKNLVDVGEGLRIVAATKLRAFFLALFEPIKNSVTTNMQVVQTSILLKYRPLYAFLHRQAPAVAQEVQRAYVAAARVYYETGFRRYSRSLGWIKARTTEKFETIITSPPDKEEAFDMKRLEFAKIDGPGVTLAYMADDKNHKEPVEALLRSLLLVLMDNATAEYTFINTFFRPESVEGTSLKESSSSLFSPEGFLSPDRASFTGRRSVSGFEFGGLTPRARADSTISTGSPVHNTAAKEEQATLDATWKQVIDPILDYCQAFVHSVLDPIPPAVPLLTMIRLTEDVVSEVQKRNCSPLESYLFTLRLKMWPVFQKAMSEHIDGLKKLAEGSSGRYFGRAAATSDSQLQSICQRYITIFNAFVLLTSQEEETMIFSNLLRLQQELTKLIARHTDQIVDSIVRATTQSALFESLLQGLTRGTHSTTHPKLQKEIAYWAEKEEEARRRIISVNRGKR